MYTHCLTFSKENLLTLGVAGCVVEGESRYIDVLFNDNKPRSGLIDGLVPICYLDNILPPVDTRLLLGL